MSVCDFCGALGWGLQAGVVPCSLVACPAMARAVVVVVLVTVVAIGVLVTAVAIGALVTAVAIGVLVGGSQPRIQ